MKRFHVHVAVPDLQQSIRFYSTLFGSEPSVVKPDYAKWMLEDPRVNFAISQRDGARAGINHLGFQAESDAELEAIHGRLQNADADVVQEKDASCCYARSDKYWVKDPAGIAWESFRSLGTVPFYGSSEAKDAGACAASKSGCCAEDAKATSGADKSKATCCA
jgi:catechol 2,3-dioxygenase-like lactoylglutathione lyase family enzyme